MEYDINTAVAKEEMIGEIKDAIEESKYLLQQAMTNPCDATRDALGDFVTDCRETRLRQVSHWNGLSATLGMLGGGKGKYATVIKTIEDGWENIISHVCQFCEDRFSYYP